jgi:hypothetical protein
VPGIVKAQNIAEVSGYTNIEAQRRYEDYAASRQPDNVVNHKTMPTARRYRRFSALAASVVRPPVIVTEPGHEKVVPALTPGSLSTSDNSSVLGS